MHKLKLVKGDMKICAKDRTRLNNNKLIQNYEQVRYLETTNLTPPNNMIYLNHLNTQLKQREKLLVNGHKTCRNISRQK